MKILVTGANGLVGSRLSSVLAARGHDVVGVSRGPRRAEGAWTYRSCELGQRDEVGQAVQHVRPEVILHTASMTDVDGCERDREGAYSANVAAAANLALQAAALDAHLLYVSTDYVFDGEAGPYSEDDRPNPRGVYALTKHMGEEAVRALAGSWAIARTAVVYGWPPAGRPNFGSWLVGALEKGGPVKLFEDQFVSPSLADNVADMLAELGERRLGGLWNICGAEVVDRVTYGKALCEVFGFDSAMLVPVKLKDLNLASPRPLLSGLKTDKAQAQLKTQPLRLREALTKFHRAVREAT